MSLSRRAFLGLGPAILAACGAPRRGGSASALDARRAARRVPGVAVAHVRRGAPDAFEASGDLDARTVLEVASLSKPVFAFAVLTEAARGAIDLDAPLARVSPPPYRHERRGAVDMFDDPRLARVTPRLLLSHRAGLPNWARREPLAFESDPGSEWSYSGEGYVLLQRAITAARGESLDTYVRRAVFAPLGMDRSTFDPRRIPSRVEGHDRARAVVPSSLDGEVAASSLLSCAADYARFARRLVEAPPGDRVVDAMLTKQVDVDPDRAIGWGVGMALAEPEWFFHWGANPGFRSLLVGSRKRGEAVLALTDSEGGMELAAEVVRGQFGDLQLLGYPRLYPPD